jgi:hypothetical protein
MATRRRPRRLIDQETEGNLAILAVATGYALLMPFYIVRDVVKRRLRARKGKA